MLRKIVFGILGFVLAFTNMGMTLQANELEYSSYDGQVELKNLVKNGDFELTETATTTRPGANDAWLDYELWENDLKPTDWELQMWKANQDPSKFTGKIVEEDGNKYVNLRNDLKSVDSQMFFKQMDIPVESGTIYRVSLDYKINELNGSNIIFRTEEFNGSTMVSRVDKPLTKKTDWDKFSMEFTAKPGVTTYNIVIVSPGNTTSDFSIDNLEVGYNDKEVNSIQMDTTPLKLRENAISYVNATALPETALNKTLHFNSSNESVVSVDDNGKLTAVSKGDAIITVTSDSNPNIFVTKNVSVIGEHESMNPNIMPNGDFELTEDAPTGNASGNTWMDHDLWINDVKVKEWNFQKWPVSAETSKFKAEILEEDGNKLIKFNVENDKSSQAFFKTRIEEMPDYGMYDFGLDIKVNSSSGAKPFIRVEDSYRSGAVIKTTEYPIDFEEGEWTSIKHIHTLQKNSAANFMIVLPYGSVANFDIDNVWWSEVEKDVTSIEIDQEPIHIKKDEQYAISATVLPDYASDKGLYWESSDESIATVNNDGLVSGHKEGHVTITATSLQKPSVTNTKEIYVHEGNIEAESLIIRELEEEIGANNKRFLKYSVYPSSSENIENLEVEWSVNDESVATIENNVITFLRPGEVIVTVESKALNIKGEQTVLVKDSTYTKDFQILKDRWLDRIVGNEENNNAKDKDTKAYIEKAEQYTEELLSTLDTREDRDKLWVKSSNSNNITAEFQKIRGLAISFGMQNNKYYEDPELHQTIVDAVDFMLTTTTFGKSWSGNWWDWQVGGSQALTDIMLLLDSYNYSGTTEQYAKALSQYNYDVKKQINGAVNTGANLSDSALVVLGVAIVRNDDDRMQHLKKEVPTIFAKGTTGDGMYDDGSLIQHGNHGYNGSYGAELIKGSGIIISMMMDTEWEINKENTTNLEYFFETVEKGFLTMVHNGHVLDFVSGRDVSRPPQRTFSSKTQKNGSNYMASLLTVADFAPLELQTKIKEHVKYWYENSYDHFDYLSDPRDFQQLSSLQKLIVDDQIDAKIDTGFRAYNMMSRARYRTDLITATVTMTNRRIANYESINGEHLKGWNTGDGALYIYNKELDNFNESYRPTVDYNRIPGTTTDTKDYVSPTRNSGTVSAGIDWANGTTNGTNGTVATMVDKAKQNQVDTSGEKPNLKATKSYYFIDGKIIALGSNINGETKDSLETIIENRIITKSGKGYSTLNGETITDLVNKDVNENDWAYLRGKNQETSFGYVFLEGGNIDAGMVQRSGKFEDINLEFNIPDVFTEDFFQIRYNHGTIANDDTYAYAILPGYSSSETETFASDQNVHILKQDNDAHIIYDAQSNILMANVFNPNVSLDLSNTNLSLDKVSFDSIGSFILEKENANLVATMADGTLRNTPVTITVEGKLDSVVSNGSKMTVTEDDKAYTIVYDTSGTQGVQQEAVIKTYRSSKDLKALVDDAKTYVETDYTKTSFDSFKVVLDKASLIVNSKVNHEAIIEELTKAINDLVLAGDYEAFNAYLDAVLNIMDDKNYTNYSQSLIKEKVEEYRDLVEERETQGVLDDAKVSLENFVSTQERRLDLSKAEEIIKTVDNLDFSKYTSETGNELRLQITALKEIFAAYDENQALTITQADIDKAIEAVNERLQGLELINDEVKPDPNEEKEKPKDPNTGISMNTAAFTSTLVLALGVLFILLKRKRQA